MIEIVKKNNTLLLVMCSAHIVHLQHIVLEKFVSSTNRNKRLRIHFPQEAYPTFYDSPLRFHFLFQIHLVMLAMLEFDHADANHRHITLELAYCICNKI